MVIMRKLAVANLVSLDGFMSGPAGDVSVMPFDSGFSEYNLECLKAAEFFLLGRTTFEGFRSYWPSKVSDPSQPPLEREVARINMDLQKIVVSDSLTPEDTTGWGPVRIVKRSEAIREVTTLKQGDGGDIFIHGSHVLWNSLLAAGLVDELRLMVGPGAIGDGVPAFEAPVRGLTLLESRRFEQSNLILLRYATNSA
jgi:dihydrofolate reductase